MLSLHPLSWMTFSVFRVLTYRWQIPFHCSLGVCVVLGSAGALFAVHRHFLWHLHLGTRCWRGSRGTWRHPPSFHVAGVALRDIYLVITPLVFTLLVRTQLVFTLLVHTQLVHLSSHHLCLHTNSASETNSLRDSRCFLLFCQAPTSSRRCCCSIHAYIHTYLPTYIHTSHRACRKTSQNLRLRYKECRPLL